MPLASTVGLQSSQQQCMLRAEAQQETRKEGKRGGRRFWCMQVRWELWVSKVGTVQSCTCTRLDCVPMGH